jgi:ribosomal protection tetracycline resistance protein
LKKIINIAILAHVDAGKTSLTEQLLYQAGRLKMAGNVDKGTAVTDFLQVEKDRGISVMASHASLNYKGVLINIIDTPGHADFVSEVERSLLAVDAVILMISAADGVQAQTRVLWEIVERMRLPRIILINKVDRKGIVLDDVLEEVKKELSEHIIPVQVVEQEGTDQVSIKSLRDYVHDGVFGQPENALERLAEFSDDILEAYLGEENIGDKHFLKAYREQWQLAHVFPVLYSVAKNADGVTDLLEELVADFCQLDKESIHAFSAVVFKISHHVNHGKLVHIRLFSGSLEVKQLVYNQRMEMEEKVNRIFHTFSDQLKDQSSLSAGDIAAVTGLINARVGDVLGNESLKKEINFDTIPILQVQVLPQREQDYIPLSDALSQLDKEDPLLAFQWLKDEREFHLKINGQIQAEILQQILIDRFHLETIFQAPKIIYKETPARRAIGYDEYTMPKPCWAVVKFKIEPGERGSGVSYHSELGVNEVLLKYQKEVERTIPLALEQGVKGWEVTDIKITLVGGEDHVVHSRAGDFVIATPMAIMDGLRNAGTILLEPIMKFVLKAPEEFLGQIASDLVQMRGSFHQPEILNGFIKMEGLVPAATSLEYATKLAIRTSGRGNILLQLNGYEQVEDELGVIRKFKGISPLDRAKYILKARKAIQ